MLDAFNFVRMLSGELFITGEVSFICIFFSGSFGEGWAAQYNDANQFLEIDLDEVTKVTRIATQGRLDAAWWVKTYTLSYSEDGGTFKDYKNGEVNYIPN